MRPARLAAAAVLGSAVFALAPGAAAADRREAEARFYFSGDGLLEIEHGHFDERLVVRYRAGDGTYDPDGLARLRRFFRARADAPAGDVSLRLIELIDFVEDRYRPRRMILISGYRSPEFNQEIRAAGARAAQSSLHTEGAAADIKFVGLDPGRLWRALRDLEIGGVGLYRQEGFLHLDIGRPRFWEPQTSRVEQNLSAGNARLFARTDFDRYATLAGAVVQLHGLTELPLRLARHVHYAGRALAIEPVDAVARADEDCWLINEPAAAYRFRVTDDAAAPLARGRRPLTLTTCPPRVAATPRTIETNPIEALRP